MKTNTLFTLFIALLFIGFTGCKKESESETNSPPKSFSVTEAEGIVGYWNQSGVNSFTINTSVPNTIDSQITGLVKDLPSDFRTEGITVIFSGDYLESSSNPEPILGGQSIYSLTLSSIKLK